LPSSPLRLKAGATFPGLMFVISPSVLRKREILRQIAIQQV
jgi:hypothetical protein